MIRIRSPMSNSIEICPHMKTMMFFVINGDFKISGSIAAMSTKTTILNRIDINHVYLNINLPMRSLRAFLWVWKYLNGKNYEANIEEKSYRVDLSFPNTGFDKECITDDSLWKTMTIAERLDAWHYFGVFGISGTILVWWWNALFYSLPTSPGEKPDLYLLERIYRELPTNISPLPAPNREAKNSFMGSLLDKSFISLFPVEKRISLIPPSIRGFISEENRINDMSTKVDLFTEDVILISGMKRGTPMILRPVNYWRASSTFEDVAGKMRELVATIGVENPIKFEIRTEGYKSVVVFGGQNRWICDSTDKCTALFPEYTSRNSLLEELAFLPV